MEIFYERIEGKDDMIEDSSDLTAKSFSLSMDSNIVLYGAGYLGKSICKNLQDQGYSVWGFIDANADSIRFVEKISVYSVEDIKKKVLSGELDCNSIVIICLQNGLQHEIVANKMYLLGLENIIFLPMNLNICLTKQSVFRKCFRKVIRFQFEAIKNIPKYKISDNQDRFIVIDEDDDEIIFWCPVQYLKIATKAIIDTRMQKELVSGRNILYKYADLEIQSCAPYLELMKWLSGDKDADIDLYLDAMGRVGQFQRRKLLEDRKQLFEIYQHEYQYNMPFFMESPAMAVWNIKGYFNVEDGVHRIHFLLNRGRREVPVLVKKSEFMLFLEFCGYNSL